MKILILMGSPNRKGSTNILVEEFTKGAKERGHSCEVIDVCRADVHPCTGCISCGYEGPCAQKDGMERIRNTLLSSDMVVFATPLYYYGMSAQLKTVVDRFCAFSSSLNSRGLRSALLSVAWNSDDWTFGEKSPTECRRLPSCGRRKRSAHRRNRRGTRHRDRPDRACRG